MTYFNPEESKIKKENLKRKITIRFSSEDDFNEFLNVTKIKVLNDTKVVRYSTKTLRKLL